MDDDALIRCKGMEVLIEHLGLVETERFIVLTKRDKFDYTEWRRENLFKGKTIDQIFHEAAAYSAALKNAENEEKLSAKSPKPKARPAKRTARKPAAKRKSAKELATA